MADDAPPTTPHWSDRAKKFWHAWFSPDQDGNVLDDSAMAEALESDGIVADFVEDARAAGEDLTAALAEREQLRAQVESGVELHRGVQRGVQEMDATIAEQARRMEALRSALREARPLLVIAGPPGRRNKYDEAVDRIDTALSTSEPGDE